MKKLRYFILIALCVTSFGCNVAAPEEKDTVCPTTTETVAVTTTTEAATTTTEAATTTTQHIHSYVESVTSEPDCEIDGIKTFACNCGDVYTEAIKATGHSYDEGVITTEADCTTDGIKTFTCGCGDSYTEAVAALGHQYESAIVAPLCTEKGYTKHICTLCGDTYTDNETEALGHKYIEVITTEAGCETEGVKSFTCECGAGYTEAIMPTGHKFETYKSNKDATYTADGTETAVCVCGKTDTRTVVGSKKQYTFTEMSATMWTTEDLTVRDLPSTKGNKLGKFPNADDEVKVTGQCNETSWYRVEFNGGIGYVNNNYLTSEEPSDESIKSITVTGTTRRLTCKYVLKNNGSYLIGAEIVTPAGLWCGDVDFSDGQCSGIGTVYINIGNLGLSETYYVCIFYTNDGYAEVVPVHIKSIKKNNPSFTESGMNPNNLSTVPVTDDWFGANGYQAYYSDEWVSEDVAEIRGYTYYYYDVDYNEECLGFKYLTGAGNGTIIRGDWSEHYAVIVDNYTGNAICLNNDDKALKNAPCCYKYDEEWYTKCYYYFPITDKSGVERNIEFVVCLDPVLQQWNITAYKTQIEAAGMTFEEFAKRFAFVHIWSGIQPAPIGELIRVEDIGVTYDAEVWITSQTILPDTGEPEIESNRSSH